MTNPDKLSYFFRPFVLLVTALTICGCQPEKEEPSNKSTSSVTENEGSGSETIENASTTETAENGLVIDGDLSTVDWSSLVDQEVTIKGDLVVVDTYDLARRGQIKVSRDRLYVPTNLVDPNDDDPEGTSFEGGSNVKQVNSTQKKNNDSTLTLDDGSDKQNVFPPALFPNLGKTHPTVRIGSVIHGLKGKVSKVRNNFVLVPSSELAWEAAERPRRPEIGEGGLTVASFNVLNFFSTIDNGNNKARGADTESEKTRQLAKIVSAIVSMDADVIGIMELENNLDAEKQLVAALNEKTGQEVFAGCGLPAGFAEAPGGDNAIRVGIIYRKDRVSLVGGVAMIVDEAFDLARTPLVSSFQTSDGGDPVTVIVNHFKSKGGSNRAEKKDKDKGDGQGAYNATRTGQALAIGAYIEGLKKEGSDPRVLVMGDLNSYAQEDPIDALRSKGLVDLKSRIKASANEASHYSYIYYGQSGSLDHAMATKSLAEDVTGVAIWHINADEPRFLDYNEEYNPKALFQADPFRSSDHDPVLIGIKN